MPLIFTGLKIHSLCCQGALRRKISVSKPQTTNQFHKSTNSAGRLNQPVRLFGQLFIKQGTRLNALSQHTVRKHLALLSYVWFYLEYILFVLPESAFVYDEMHSFSLSHDILRKPSWNMGQPSSSPLVSKAPDLEMEEQLMMLHVLPWEPEVQFVSILLFYYFNVSSSKSSELYSASRKESSSPWSQSR